MHAKPLQVPTTPILNLLTLLLGAQLALADTVETRFAFLPIGEVKPGGWIKAQMQRDLRGFAGHLHELTDRARSQTYGPNRVSSFKKNPDGTIVDTPRTWWNGETEAVWMDGFVRMAYLVEDAKAIAMADAYIDSILTSQDEDGYIGIYTPQSRYQHKKENGELWTQSRIFLVLLAYYEATGRREVLGAVERAARLTMSKYGPGRSYFNNEKPAGGTGHGLMFVDAAEWLYRLTGDDAYRDFARWCYADYCTAAKIRDKDNQLHNLLDLEKPFVGHTPHTMEHLRVPLWLYYATGDPTLQQATENGFAKTRRYLVPSGACIGDESIRARKPAPSVPYEYCAITEWLTSLQSAVQKTGDATYADLGEWLAYNAAQGARLPDGKAISYLTTDNRYSATKGAIGGRLKFSPTHEDVAVCCNPNATKLMPYYVNRMWMRTRQPADGLAALFYGPCSVNTKLKGVDIRIDEATDFPFSETIKFKVTPRRDVTFALCLRNPGWSKATVVDATDAEVRRSGDYYIVRKTWRKGDEITVTFAAKVERLRTANGEVAIKRGPLLYALPIPATRRVTKLYELAGFADYDFLPVPVPPGPASVLFRVGAGRGANQWASAVVKCDPAFASIAIGKGEPVHYRAKADHGARYTVVFGLCEGWHKNPDQRVLELKIEGKTRKTVDMIADHGRNVPALFAFEARDADGDGWIDVAVTTTPGSPDHNAVLNVLWVFPGKQVPPLNDLLTGKNPGQPLAKVDCAPDSGNAIRWDFKLETRKQDGGPGFVVQRDDKADPLHPWDRSPIRLTGALINASSKRVSASLVPIGATILRQVTFPIAADR